MPRPSRQPTWSLLNHIDKPIRQWAADRVSVVVHWVHRMQHCQHCYRIPRKMLPPIQRNKFTSIFMNSIDGTLSPKLSYLILLIWSFRCEFTDSMWCVHIKIQGPKAAARQKLRGEHRTIIASQTRWAHSDDHRTASEWHGIGFWKKN